MLNRKKSEELYEKAKTYFPGGVNSPVRAFRSVGGTPLIHGSPDNAKILLRLHGFEQFPVCG